METKANSTCSQMGKMELHSGKMKFPLLECDFKQNDCQRILDEYKVDRRARMSTMSTHAIGAAVTFVTQQRACNVAQEDARVQAEAAKSTEHQWLEAKEECEFESGRQ